MSEVKMTPLKNCPRCGPKGKSYISAYPVSDGNTLYYAHCIYCGIKTALHASQGDAFEDWNRRPWEDEQAKKAEIRSSVLSYPNIEETTNLIYALMEATTLSDLYVARRKYIDNILTRCRK